MLKCYYCAIIQRYQVIIRSCEIRITILKYWYSASKYWRKNTQFSNFIRTQRANLKCSYNPNFILSEVCLLYDSNNPQNILKLVRLGPIFRKFRRKMPLLYWNLNKYNEMGLQFNFKNTLTICSSQLAKKLMCDVIFGYFNMNDRMTSKFHILHRSKFDEILIIPHDSK